MKESLRTFMDGLIDYAGLFPPAKLPLNEAIDEYLVHLKGDNSWMLGRFIIPISQFKDLEQFIPLFEGLEPLRLSVLGGGGNSDDEYLNNIEQNIIDINKFREKYPREITIDVIECKLATNSPSKKIIKKATDLLNQNDLIHYHEFDELPYVGIDYSTELDETNWDSEVVETIAMISKIDNAGIKLRCGGVIKEAFPSIEKVAAMIQACALNQVPMKFTAGLHHPLRHFEEQYDCDMHGFVNVFGAGILASNFEQPQHSQEKYRMFILLSHMIDDDNPENFSFDDSKLTWKVGDDRDTRFEMNLEKIKDIRRNRAISYGSCSFEEPIGDLKQLGWM
jgi:hypothetical protein